MQPRTYSFIFILFLFTSSIFAQNELKVGSKAPEIIFQQSFPNAKYKIPKNKPFILDFWATWCGPCVAGLIESNEFVEKYSSRIDYIAITDNTSSDVVHFIKSKSLKQHFIIDISGQTFKSFYATSLPTAFLIDENGIIQWTGSASKLTPILIDEFLKSGKIELSKKVAKNTNVATKEDNAEKKELDLTINELPIPEFEYSSSERLKPDTFECIYNRLKIKTIIRSLYDGIADRIIYKIPNELADRRISVTYRTTNCNVGKTKLHLLENIAALYSFEINKETIDTLVWELIVVDSLKLNNFKTVMTSKFEGMGKGKGSFWGRGSFLQESSTCLNLSLFNLARTIGLSYGLICETQVNDKLGYDFIKVDGREFSNFRNKMLNKYGIKMISKKKKIDFLVIENQVKLNE